MTDVAISVFRLLNRRGYHVPNLNVDYTEAKTGFEWRLTCGGTRAYAVRLGALLDPDLDSQAADSHFMVRRVTSSLLVAGLGLFQAEPVGRLIFKELTTPVKWTSILDLVDPLSVPGDDEVARALDWCRALCMHTCLRRASDDAHLALTHPHEALIFVYRGLEWIKRALALEWAELAREMKVPESELRELKKMANHETGVRHASTTGTKLRAEPRNYGTWVCGLLDAINAARHRIEPAFVPMSSEQVAQAVMRALSTVPYE